MKQKPKVLIIDDNKNMRETLADILEEKGYDVVTAKTAQEAISAAGKCFFNIHLIDIRLPDSSGIEVLRVLGKMSPYTMNVMITGHPTLQNTIESMNVGANAYIMKPIDHETLGKILEECLKKQQLLIFPNEVPASLRKPEIRLLLQKIRDKKIAEFIPSIDDEKGVFYPEIEKIIPDPVEYHQAFEILEKYGILKREFDDSVLACPSCASVGVSVRISCPSCRSANIDKQAGIFFKCNVCGKQTSMPEHKYVCGNCKKSYTENQLKTIETFTFVVSSAHESLIDKWIEDLDNILSSAREFYRQAQPYGPKVSYSVMAKKGESIRDAVEKAQE